MAEAREDDRFKALGLTENYEEPLLTGDAGREVCNGIRQDLLGTELGRGYDLVGVIPRAQRFKNVDGTNGEWVGPYIVLKKASA